MSKRIGKYVVDKRESELSLADGGTVRGTLHVTGNVTLSALSQSTDPGVDGQLYVTGSQWDGTGNSMQWTGSSYVVLCSAGN